MQRPSRPNQMEGVQISNLEKHRPYEPGFYGSADLESARDHEREIGNFETLCQVRANRFNALPDTATRTAKRFG